MTHNVALQRARQLFLRAVGTASASSGALIVVSVWAFSGLLFRFSDAWQRVTTTGIAIVALVAILDVRRALTRQTDAVERKIEELVHFASRSRKYPPPLPQMPVERDNGYGPSHGYGVGHGGPAGPGDAPARLLAPPPPLRRPASTPSVRARRDAQTA
jgi:hypothetical protein